MAINNTALSAVLVIASHCTGSITTVFGRVMKRAAMCRSGVMIRITPDEYNTAG